MYFTTKKTNPSPPTSPQVDDKNYAGYLRSSDKVLPIWSNTFQSKSADSGKPAYLAMLTNESQIRLTKKFIEKHNYSEIMVYTGCVEWTANEWQHKSFPYWSQMESFLRNFDGLRLGAMIYLNDKKDNITEYALLKTFAGAYANYNQYQTEPRKLHKILVSIEPVDEAGALKTLEAVYLLTKELNSMANTNIN